MTTRTALESLFAVGKISQRQFRKLENVSFEYEDKISQVYSWEEKSKHDVPNIHKSHVADDTGMVVRINSIEPVGVNLSYSVRYTLTIYKTPVSEQ